MGGIEVEGVRDVMECSCMTFTQKIKLKVPRQQ